MNVKPTPINPLAESQMVIIIARFVLVAACLLLILMDARTAKTVTFAVSRFEIIVVMLLAVSNFYLVSQVMTKRKTQELVLYGMSLADLAVISMVVIAQGGFSSGTYIFYFPAMLSFALAFPTMELYLFLAGTVSIYSFIGLVSIGDVNNLEILMIRVLMLTAVAVCGNRFAQIERSRRAAILSKQFAAQQPQVETSAYVAQQHMPVG
jgi:membrane-associated HD superfamily phosphohydrolase